MVASTQFFELGWGVLSGVGLLNTVIGLAVIGITTCTRLSIVPVICSAACALANGMCFVAFYSDAPTSNRVAAAIIADLAWLVQEAGLSFYSFQILRNLLTGLQKRLYLSLFWFLMVAIVGTRSSIAAFRVYTVEQDSRAYQTKINRLHTGFFISIALVETWSAFFLIKVLLKAHDESRRYLEEKGATLWQYCLKSTEVRLSTLALIGITRAVTYSFQIEAQDGTGVAGAFDRFAYLLECMFPIVMMVDLLASKIPLAQQYRRTNLTSGGKGTVELSSGGKGAIELHETPDVQFDPPQNALTRLPATHFSRPTQCA